MEHFDELVTDPIVRLADVETHLATLSGGDEVFNGRYRVASTSGSTGRRGLFLWDSGEWAAVLASYNRFFDRAGVGAGLISWAEKSMKCKQRDRSAREG